MVRANKIRWYTCKSCGRKVTMEYGNGLPTLISHLYHNHSDQIQQHRQEPINIMINNCYEVK